jgi:hypothetical protein
MGRWGRGGWLGLAAVGLLGLLVFFSVGRQSPPAPGASLPVPTSPLGRASAQRLPRELKGVFLGMEAAGLKLVRPRAKHHAAADGSGYAALTEVFPAPGTRKQVLYLFESGRRRLARVQIAEPLAGPEAVIPRIADLQSEYGPPSGVWNCPPREGQLPSRRMTWTRGLVGVMDVVLMLREHASATLYVAAVADVQTSLEQAACVAVSPEKFNKFPAVFVPHFDPTPR